MRSNHAGPLIAVVLATALVATACSGKGSGTGRSQATVASHLVMGGPAECLTRITCLVGLEKIYGIHFKSFKVLDEVGPLSEAAIGDGEVQVVRLDSSDPTIPAHGWVILQDDKSFQQAGNIIPVIRSSVATPGVTTLIDKVSSSMTQGDLFMLDAEVGIENQTPQAAAQDFVHTLGIAAAITPDAVRPDFAQTIIVGSASFSENETLADVYVDVLQDAGYKAIAKVNDGSREAYEPELASGRIDLLPEYVGNFLQFLDPTVSNLPLANSVSMLRTILAPDGLTVLDPSSATDADTIVVTRATADKYHLTKISDLAAPYPG
jgi:osmoprotectant transport system substrate-binding protein